jgi:hypothetical protein
MRLVCGLMIIVNTLQFIMSIVLVRVTLNILSAYKRVSNRNTKMNKQSKNLKQKITKQVKKIVKKQTHNKVKPAKAKKHSSPSGRLGENIGGSLGKWVGGGVQSLIGKITGLGDYHVGGARTVNIDSGPPQFASGRNVRVAHREYLGDIIGSTLFTKTTYELNPGDAETFPWLSRIAPNFEEYKFHGLVFEFKSTSATALNSTNTALGTVVCATQYDSVEPGFNNKREMENHEFASSTMPYQSVLHGVETKPKYTSISTNLYVLSGPQPPDTDIRLYNLGKFTIATVGMQAACTIGELWVTYDVEFFKPQLLPSGSTNIYAHYSNTTNDSSSCNSLSPFGRYGSEPQPLLMVPSSGSSEDLITFQTTYDPERTVPYYWNRIQFNEVGTYALIIGSVSGENDQPGVGSIYKGSDVSTTGYMFEHTAASRTYNNQFYVTVGGNSYSVLFEVVTVDSASVGNFIDVNMSSYDGEPSGLPATCTMIGTDVLVIPMPTYFTTPLSKMQKLAEQIKQNVLSELQDIEDEKCFQPNPSVTPKILSGLTVNQNKLSDSTVLARAISKLGLMQ